jgi:hypothetical protein
MRERERDGQTEGGREKGRERNGRIEGGREEGRVGGEREMERKGDGEGSVATRGHLASNSTKQKSHRFI